MSWAILLKFLSNWWRTFALAAGFAFALLAVYTSLLRKDYLVVTTERQADKVKFEARESELLAAIDAYKQQEAHFTELVNAESAKLEAARQASAQATQAANTAKAQAERSLKGWQSQYSKRPEACKAALEALEAACPAQSGY